MAQTLTENLCLQRTRTQRRYQDDGISDDEIEGKRMFDLDEKLECERFGSELIKHMEGKGETSVLKFIFYFFKTEPFVIISRALWDELMCYFFVRVYLQISCPLGVFVLFLICVSFF